VERGESHCRLALADDERARAIYPFAFRFEVAYAIENDALEVSYTIFNTGDETLPASLGAHPAFIWPLADGAAKESHTLEFSAPETAPIHRLPGGLLSEATEPSPVDGKILKLHDGLFAADAIVMTSPASRSVRYSAPGAASIEISWDENFPHLGLWSKPGADFLCIEPWHGFSTPENFNGDFIDKPGLLHIAPGQKRSARWAARVL
jgi:galactose mutarotase-like enzyme